MVLYCYRTLDHAGQEFSAFPRRGGLVSPSGFASMIGGDIPDHAVRSFFVAVSAPGLPLFVSFSQVQEPTSVQPLAAQLAVECFDERFVLWRSTSGNAKGGAANSRITPRW